MKSAASCRSASAAVSLHEDDRDYTARDFIDLIAGQASAMYGLTLDLEKGIGEHLLSGAPLSDETMHMVQRIDYLRQALADIEAMLARIGPDVVWREGAEMRKTELSSLVAMRSSLGDRSATPDISGEADLWS